MLILGMFGMRLGKMVSSGYGGIGTGSALSAAPQVSAGTHSLGLVDQYE